MTTWANRGNANEINTTGTRGLQEQHIRKATANSTHLQVRSNERPASRIVKVAFHEEVEKMGGIAADGAQLGVTALEDFVAQRGTHVGPAVEEGAGELEDAWGETGCNALKKT